MQDLTLKSSDTTNTFKHGSLFSGIGGFDLAAEWIGWYNIFHCEWNEFGQKVLKHHFPKSISYGDITKTNFSIHKGEIDIISGGFPCQPYSTSGKRLGKEDERHLWPEMLRAIVEIQPSWVVGENVSGIISWDGGLVFDEVQSDLEAKGYEVIPFLLPACGTNADHRRERVWFIAHSNGTGLQKSNCQFRQIDGISKKTPIEFTRSLASQWDTRKRGSGMLCRDNGVSKKLDGISVSNWKKESIKAFGNAIVPQVAYQIFKAISMYENNN